jgi:hypothetical protein
MLLEMYFTRFDDRSCHAKKWINEKEAIALES